MPKKVELCSLKKVWGELNQVGQPADLIAAMDVHFGKVVLEIMELRKIRAAALAYVNSTTDESLPAFEALRAALGVNDAQ